jgi:hypothetical protein
MAPLGARARKARPKGVFSVGKAAEKTDFIVFSYFYNYPKSKNMKG